jgi:DNA topoisomerase-1
LVHTALVDAELAEAMKALRFLEGGRRLFRYELPDGTYYNLSNRRLNEYIREHMGEEFTAKDFRTGAGHWWPPSPSRNAIPERRRRRSACAA